MNRVRLRGSRMGPRVTCRSNALKWREGSDGGAIAGAPAIGYLPRSHVHCEWGGARLAWHRHESRVRPAGKNESELKLHEYGAALLRAETKQQTLLRLLGD